MIGNLYDSISVGVVYNKRSMYDEGDLLGNCSLIIDFGVGGGTSCYWYFLLCGLWFIELWGV